MHFEPSVAFDVNFEMLGIFSLKKLLEVGVPFALDAQRMFWVQLKEAFSIV